jgi:hypothetical protein
METAEEGTPLIAGNSVVARDGAMFTVYADFSREHTGTQSIGAIRLTGTADRGKTLLRSSTVGTFRIGGAFSVPGIGIDTSSGPFAGHMYATWVSERDGRHWILVARSEDRGQHWSEPVTVNDDPPGQQPAPEHTMPVIAVNSRGAVGVVWYDRREFRGMAGFRVRFTASVDGGKTFLPSVPVSEQPYSLADRPLIVTSQERSEKNGISIELRPAQFARRAGDTAGLAATADGVFHPLWIDNRTGVPQAWTAPVKVSQLSEMTSRVSVSVHGTTLVEGRRIAARVRVKNTSTEEIRQPIIVHVMATHMRPDVVTWRIDGLLKPGESAPDHDLVFDLPTAFDAAGLTPTLKLATVSIRIFAEQ